MGRGGPDADAIAPVGTADQVTPEMCHRMILGGLINESGGQREAAVRKSWT